jgi:hypothetical protein
VRKHAAAVGSRIEVIQRIPVVQTTKQRLVQCHIEILVGTKTIATVSLPGLVTEHSLPAIEVVGSPSVICVEILLFAIEILRMGKQANQS